MNYLFMPIMKLLKLNISLLMCPILVKHEVPHEIPMNVQFQFRRILMVVSPVRRIYKLNLCQPLPLEIMFQVGISREQMDRHS